MAGFSRLYNRQIYSKMVSTYIVVVFEQMEQDGIIVRKETGIFSPGTIFNPSETLTNHITCVWIHKTNKLFHENYVFGFTTLDFA
ncbi:hypothetical protein 162275966 [Organic Lake phycodnavirus 2]|nr:hypothetical protein 162275966 [Organic Lake phycodnavirus 2]